MSIVLVGLNHKTAPVSLREKLALDVCAPDEAYLEIKKCDSLKERIFVSTCNRVEVIAISRTAEERGRAIEEIKVFLGARHGVDPREFEGALYIYEDTEAIVHLFRVASSLDSMVVGEPQILGQLKEAFRQAVDNQATGAVLNKLLHKSFSVAKRVRTETGIASHAVSIGFAAVELARKIFGDLEGKTVLLIGAGEMAELAAEHLLTHGASDVVVANRTLQRAVGLAKRWNGRAASMEEVPSLLAEVDIVISSTGAPEVIVETGTVKSVLKARKHRPLFFVDIAVPRDVDQGVNRLDNVYLYDIDDLEGVVESNRAARHEEAAAAERIIQEETLSFTGWLETLDTFPTIVALKDKAEDIRKVELKKTLGKMGDLTAEQAEAIEVLTRSLTHKLIHDPIIFIKTAGRHGRKDFNLHMARRILGLDNEDDALEPDEDETDDPGPDRV